MNAQVELEKVANGAYYIDVEELQKKLNCEIILKKRCGNCKNQHTYADHGYECNVSVCKIDGKPAYDRTCNEWALWQKELKVKDIIKELEKADPKKEVEILFEDDEAYETYPVDDCEQKPWGAIEIEAQGSVAINNPMTVGELLEKLKQENPLAPVQIMNSEEEEIYNPARIMKHEIYVE